MKHTQHWLCNPTIRSALAEHTWEIHRKFQGFRQRHPDIDWNVQEMLEKQSAETVALKIQQAIRRQEWEKE